MSNRLNPGKNPFASWPKQDGFEPGWMGDRLGWALRIGAFVIGISFVIRISAFVIRLIP